MKSPMATNVGLEALFPHDPLRLACVTLHTKRDNATRHMDLSSTRVICCRPSREPAPGRTPGSRGQGSVGLVSSGLAAPNGKILYELIGTERFYVRVHVCVVILLLLP